MICAHEQCEHPRHALGLCDRHYRRMLAGEPITKPIRWQRRKPTIHDLAEDAQWLIDTGESWHQIPARLGVTRDSLMSRLRRGGYGEIADRLAAMGRAVHEHAMSGSRKSTYT